MKWLLSVLFLILAAGGVFVLTHFGDEAGLDGPERALGDPATGVAAGSPDLATGTGPAGTSPVRDGADPRAARDGERIARGPLVTDAQGGGALEVVVRHPVGRHGIPNADVWLLDRESLSKVAYDQAATSDRGLQKLVMDTGRKFKTDPDGVAVVPRVLDGVLLARHSGYVQVHSWMGPVPSPLELVLEEEIDLQVEVVDAEGRPVPQVPVAVCLDDPGMPRAILERSTISPSGVASFRRVEQRLQPRNDGKGYAVGLGFPTGVRQTVKIDPRNLPLEPVQLVMPEAGRLLVQAVDAAGEKLSERMVISLGHMVDPMDGTPPTFQASETRRTADGFARFEWVEARTPVAVQFSGVADLRDQVFEVQGPEAADQTREVTLAWTEAWPTLSGRAVDSAGRPLAGRNGRMILRQDGVAKGGPPLVTDETGRFRMIVTTPWHVGSERVADLELFGGLGQQPYTCSLDLSFEPPAGDTDYGNVVFEGKPLLAAGIVMAPGGPLNGAQVEAQMQIKNKEGALVWTPVPGVMTTSDTDGSFSLYGEPPPGTALQVMARRRGFQRGFFEDLTPGLQGILITLQEGSDAGADDKEGRGEPADERGEASGKGGKGGR